MQSLSKVFLRNFMESFYDSRKTCEEILNQPFLGIPMKTNTLGTTLLVIGVILGMTAWILHDRGETTPPESSPKNQNTIVLTNTGTSSGNTQVVNSGVTDFHTPNLEWKSRDVTLADGRTLHYVFGEGNPKEVELTASGIEEFGKKYCTDPEKNTVFYSIGFCNPESETLMYLSSSAEKHLIAALSDPGWRELKTLCEMDFRILDTPEMRENEVNNPSVIYFDKLFSSGFLDTNNFITIDPKTGWKNLNIQRTFGIAHYLMCAMQNGCRGDDPNAHRNCVDQHAGNIVRHLEAATDSYTSPLFYSE